MKYRIVADSSSNLFNINDISYTTVPLKVITDHKEYIDVDSLDVKEMLNDFKELRK